LECATSSKRLRANTIITCLTEDVQGLEKVYKIKYSEYNSYLIFFTIEIFVQKMRGK
jgi:hypothetical protein